MSKAIVVPGGRRGMAVNAHNLVMHDLLGHLAAGEWRLDCWVMAKVL